MPEAPCFAYMLLTHRDPQHVEELARRILDLSPACHVVIHHDMAAGDLPWEGRPPDRVHFVERGRVLWGDWSIVAATLRMVDSLPGSRRRLVRHALGRAPACGRPATMGALRHGVWCGRILRSRGVAADHPFRTVRRRRQPVPRTLPASLGHRQGPRSASGNKVFTALSKFPATFCPSPRSSMRIDGTPGLSACLVAAAAQRRPPSTREPSGSGSTGARPTPSWERTQQ